MELKGALVVMSLKATVHMSKRNVERCWREFMNYHPLNSSAQANTIPIIMNRCEREGISYELRAIPGLGYQIKRFKEFTEDARS